LFSVFTPISSAPASPDLVRAIWRRLDGNFYTFFFSFLTRGQFVTRLTTDGLTKKEKEKRLMICPFSVEKEIFFLFFFLKTKKSCEQTNLEK
jgi:hypothetical protein